MEIVALALAIVGGLLVIVCGLGVYAINKAWSDLFRDR